MVGQQLKPGQIIDRFVRMFLQDQSKDHYFVLAARYPDGRRQYKRFLVADSAKVAPWISTVSGPQHDADIYYKTAMLKPNADRMVKENFQDKALWMWADLDAMDPSTLPLQPTMLVESSPGRYQALWRLTEPVDIRLLERYCRTIAELGDKSGWDIGQELRVPGTLNHKYSPAPMVEVREASGVTYDPDVVAAAIAPAETPTVLQSGDTPEPEPYEGVVPNYALEELSVKAGDGRGRSVALWQILCQLRDDGWGQEEAFRLMWYAPANKYRSDGRPPRDLWRDVVKCWSEGIQKVTEGQGEPVTSGMAISVPKYALLAEEHPRVTLGEWPLLVRKAVELFTPVTLFSEEVMALGFLSGYSVGFPLLKQNGTSTALWTLLLGTQASGKSTILNSMLKMMQGAMPLLGIVTSGSPEGIQEGLVSGPAFVCLEEYSEQLKQMAKREGYAVTNKELYQRMFDGAPIGHKTRKGSITLPSSFSVMMAATNVDSWRKYGDPEDVANGYLSRFVVCADNLVERSVDRTELHTGEEALGVLIAERVQGLQQLRYVWLSNEIGTIQDNGDMEFGPHYATAMSRGEMLMHEYQQELESKWKASLDLDVAEKENALGIPPGRTLTKARKIAVMLELSELRPQFAEDVLVVRDENVHLAVRLAKMSQLWAQRAIDWLQESRERETVDSILSLLGRVKPRALHTWDISKTIRSLEMEKVRILLNNMASSKLIIKQTALDSSGQRSEIWSLSK